jgi:hypothetical protein
VRTGKFTTKLRPHILLQLLSKTDLFVIAIIFFSTIAQFTLAKILRSDTSEVVIYYDNNLYARKSLKHDALITIENIAVVEILDGRASIVHSTCKNQICVLQGFSRSKPIICVPNRIFLQFSQPKKSEKMFITY